MTKRCWYIPPPKPGPDLLTIELRIYWTPDTGLLGSREALITSTTWGSLMKNSEL